MKACILCKKTVLCYSDINIMFPQEMLIPNKYYVGQVFYIVKTSVISAVHVLCTCAQQQQRANCN